MDFNVISVKIMRDFIIPQGNGSNKSFMLLHLKRF